MVLDELMIYLQVRKIFHNKFLTDNLEEQWYHFIAFFSLTYGIEFKINSKSIVATRNDFVINICNEPTYKDRVFITIMKCIEYCEKPF